MWLPCTTYIRLPRRSAFLNGHSVFSIFMYALLFQTLLCFLSGLSDISQALWSPWRDWTPKNFGLWLRSLHPEHEGGQEPFWGKGLQLRGKLLENSTALEWGEELLWIDGNCSQHYENYFLFASSLFTTTVSVPKPRTHSLIHPELIGHDKLPNTE